MMRPFGDITGVLYRQRPRIPFTRLVRASEDEKAHDIEHIFSVLRDGTGLRRLTSGPFSDRNPVG